jgi:hypothetical protein
VSCGGSPPGTEGGIACVLLDVGTLFHHVESYMTPYDYSATSSEQIEAGNWILVNLRKLVLVSKGWSRDSYSQGTTTTVLGELERVF